MREQVQDAGAQARVDYELSRLARLMGPALCSLMGGHRSIGDRQSPMAYEFTGQGARRSLHRLSRRSKTLACRQHATQFFALHETQAVDIVPCATPSFLE